MRININLDASRENKCNFRFRVRSAKQFSFGEGSDPLQRFRSGVMSVWLVIGHFS